MTELIRVMRNDANWNALCDVAQRALENWYSSSSFDDCREYYAFRKHFNIVGTVMADIGEAPDAYINDVAIHPDHQRQGLGLEMMAELDGCLSSRFQRAWLITDPMNLDFYRAAGFVREETSTAMSMVMMIKGYG